jgi:hypothetical protein
MYRAGSLSVASDLSAPAHAVCQVEVKKEKADLTVSGGLTGFGVAKDLLRRSFDDREEEDDKAKEEAYIAQAMPFYTPTNWKTFDATNSPSKKSGTKQKA